jgi:hypothetical protein
LLMMSLLLLLMMMMLMCMICRFMTWCCNTVLVFPLNGSIRTCWIQPKMQRRLIVCDGWFDSMMSSSTKVVQGSTGESLGRRHHAPPEYFRSHWFGFLWHVFLYPFPFIIHSLCDLHLHSML